MKKCAFENLTIFRGKYRSSRPEVFCKKVFSEIFQNSQENICEFCEISKNNFF